MNKSIKKIPLCVVLSFLTLTSCGGPKSINPAEAKEIVEKTQTQVSTEGYEYPKSCTLTIESKIKNETRNDSEKSVVS